MWQSLWDWIRKHPDHKVGRLDNVRFIETKEKEMDPEEIDWQDDDGRERGDEPKPKFIVNKMCEGQMVPYAHLEDAVEYQLYDRDGKKDTRGILCSRCVAEDRAKGYDWRKVDV